jgi:hypothetical protein
MTEPTTKHTVGSAVVIAGVVDPVGVIVDKPPPATG